VAIDPGGLLAETALGDSAAATGQKEEARKAWTSALESARKLEPDAQVSYVPELEEKLRKM
jgi:predicted negative regulator of RcsB-dependent stress response